MDMMNGDGKRYILHMERRSSYSALLMSLTPCVIAVQACSHGDFSSISFFVKAHSKVGIRHSALRLSYGFTKFLPPHLDHASPDF